MPYKIILFDLDDTLINFAASQVISLRKIYNQFYTHVNYAVFEMLFKEINNSLWQRVGAQRNVLMSHEVGILRFKYLHEQLEIILSEHDVAAEYDAHLISHVNWLPDVRPAIEFLHQKGHILGIITNGLAAAQLKKWQLLELHNWFDCLIISDEVGIAKPNKEIFAIALEQISNKYNHIVPYDKDTILMVGDSAISDGFGAMNFGINYCHIGNDHKKTPADLPFTYHVNSVAALPNCMGYAAEYEVFLSDLIAV